MCQQGTGLRAPLLPPRQLPPHSGLKLGPQLPHTALSTHWDPPSVPQEVTEGTAPLSSQPGSDCSPARTPQAEGTHPQGPVGSCQLSSFPQDEQAQP